MGSDFSPYPFVQGLDGTFATYFTDYIAGIISLAFAVSLYRSLKRSNEVPPKKKENVKVGIFTHDSEESQSSANLIRTHFEDARSLLRSLCLGFTLCALMHIVGGMAHHSIRFVIAFPDSYNHTSSSNQIDYKKVSSGIKPIYAMWQLAKMLASSFAMCMLYLAYLTFLCDAADEICRILSFETTGNYFSAELEKPFVTNKLYRVSSKLRNKKSIVAGVIGFLTIIQILYHTTYTIAMLSRDLSYEDRDTANEDMYSGEGSGAFLEFNARKSFFLDERFSNLWLVWDMTVILVLSLLIYAVTSTVLAVLHSLRARRERANLSRRQHDGLLTDTTEDSPSITSSEKETSTNSSIALTSMRHFHFCQIRTFHVHVIRSIALWTVFLGGAIQFALAKSCGKNDALYCPLPSSFNHNATYHLFLILGSTMWYIAEYTHFKLEFEVIQQIHSIQNS